MNELLYYYNKFKFGEDNFHNLMKDRVKEILLVSTFYDAFIFEQDGRLSEQIYGEYKQLNLSTAPRITSVPTGEEALKIIEKRDFDLVITMMRIGDVGPRQLSKKIKEKNPKVPIILLLNVPNDVLILENNPKLTEFIDDVFIWKGDSKLFIAIIKYIEDKKNVDYDTKNGMVRVILLVEDSIPHYSMFLPLLYSEIVQQTQRLITSELNDMNKRLRMRARPKVLLVHSYEEAIEVYHKYREYLIAVISDVRYYHRGEEDSHAGLKLIQYLKEDDFDIPMLLQSSEIENEEQANLLNTDFLFKQSKSLLHDLKKFMLDNLGFGDFVFRNKDNEEIARVKTIDDFKNKLKIIPSDSLIYHACKNHFSSWLIAHGEFVVAKKIKPLKVKDFKDVEELRNYLINLFEEVRRNHNSGKILNFDPNIINMDNIVIRMSEGSFGGKGRGLAFLNSLLVAMEFDKRYPKISIQIPRTFIIGTQEFDRFLQTNNINIDELQNMSDENIQRLFISGNLSPELREKLYYFVENESKPLAIRSSGLLEDSQSQPFAGIYKTFMVPNNKKLRRASLQQVMNAIKLVYASVFEENTRRYIESINYKLEEEKMAVVIQEVAGTQYGDVYYPDISGVAQSYNYYPTGNLEHSDSIAEIALGLGKSVVEGTNVFRFSPKKPKAQLLNPSEIIKNRQREFYAINLNQSEYDLYFDLLEGEDATLIKLNVNEAEKHGILSRLASTWDYNNDRFTEDPGAKGMKILTFDKILKYNSFPLAEILSQILDIGEKAMGTAVEIEFAVDLNRNHAGLQSFYLLQIRPITVNHYGQKISYKMVDENVFLYSERALGNGTFDDLYDIVFVDNDTFDTTKTEEMVKELSKINDSLNAEGIRYILIGPGRWGTRDKFLGIPVQWRQISNAQTIVEVGISSLNPDYSQGTHFFHNLISMNIGYFSIPYNSPKGFVDYEWLKSQEIIHKTEHFYHIRTKKPNIVKIDGRQGRALILKG